MNRILKAASLLLVLWAGSASAANIGVSINIGDPGYYGRIDLGYAPQPQLVYAQPVIIGRPVAYAEPIYLRVPPGHRSHWSRHCGYYQACGVPVYFVQDRWYDTVYVPAYRGHHGGPRHYDRRDHGHHDRYVRYDHRDDHRDYRRDHAPSHGAGPGRGHGRDDTWRETRSDRDDHRRH